MFYVFSRVHQLAYILSVSPAYNFKIPHVVILLSDNILLYVWRQSLSIISKALREDLLANNVLGNQICLNFKRFL